MRMFSTNDKHLLLNPLIYVTWFQQKYLENTISCHFQRFKVPQGNIFFHCWQNADIFCWLFIWVKYVKTTHPVSPFLLPSVLEQTGAF